MADLTSIDLLLAIVMFVSILITAGVGLVSTALLWVQMSLVSSVLYTTWEHFFNPSNPRMLITNSGLGTVMILFFEFCLLMFLFKKVRKRLLTAMESYTRGLIDCSLGALFGFGQGVCMCVVIFLGIALGCGGVTMAPNRAGVPEANFNLSAFPDIITTSKSFGLLKSATRLLLYTLSERQLEDLEKLVTMSQELTGLEGLAGGDPKALISQMAPMPTTTNPTDNKAAVTMTPGITMTPGSSDTAPTPQEKQQLMQLLEGVLQQQENKH